MYFDVICTIVGSAVIPITLSQEIQQHTQLIHDNAFSITANTNAIEGINGALGKGPLLYTSVLQKALDLPVGFYVYFLDGVRYSEGDLPNSNYRYGTACIYKRSGSSIAIVLIPHDVFSALATSVYSGGEWSDWKIYAAIN